MDFQVHLMTQAGWQIRVNPRGAKGRYIRLYSNGNTANDMNHYVEVEVYGIPVK